MIKILFTSVGRRVELLQAFYNAGRNIGCEIEIWGTDNSKSAPALQFCNHAIQTCKIKEEQYIPQLLEICEREKIHVLIPTIDTDLMILAENRKKFDKIGTIVFISSLDKIQICRDKRKTANYFYSIGLNSPNTIDDYTKYGNCFPAFIKPIDGSSSVSAYKVNNAEELKMYASKIPEYIIQPFIDGTEYTIDIFCDLDGRPVFITPRIRLAVRAGEVLKTQIVQDDKIISEMLQLIEDFHPCGQITVQMIIDNKTHKHYYIEINPRFGGGAPLTIKAGADSAEAIIRIALGEKLSFYKNAAENGAIYSRFDQSVKVNI